MSNATEILKQRRAGEWKNPNSSGDYKPFGDIRNLRVPRWFHRSALAGIAAFMVLTGGNAQEYPAIPPKNLSLSCRKDEDGIRKIALDIRAYQNRIQQGRMTFAMISASRDQTDLFPYEELTHANTPEMKNLYEEMYAGKWVYDPRKDLGDIIQIQEGYATPETAKQRRKTLASMFVSPQLCFNIRQSK